MSESQSWSQTVTSTKTSTYTVNMDMVEESSSDHQYSAANTGQAQFIPSHDEFQFVSTPGQAGKATVVIPPYILVFF